MTLPPPNPDARTYEPKDPSRPWEYPHHPECDDPYCEDENVVCWKHAEDICQTCGTMGTLDGETACPDCKGTGAEPLSEEEEAMIAAARERLAEEAR